MCIRDREEGMDILTLAQSKVGSWYALSQRPMPLLCHVRMRYRASVWRYAVCSTELAYDGTELVYGVCDVQY
eukprot:1755771-Rhodomonas_salina.1